MRCERSPEPIRSLRVDAVFACCSESCLSRMRAASTPSAFSRFLCCERESWHSTTMPVGRCVTRIAESVLLTCWPPAPEARKVSMRSSAGFRTTSSILSASGRTATVQAEVWMRPCASGAGGQHVNKTDSAIRVTHLPTGIVVECQDERSQHKNRSRAMALMKAKLLAAEQEKRDSDIARDRKLHVGTSDTSAPKRTYKSRDGRVTDHRINLTLYK